MKSVLISIKPKWCELIVSGKKTIEVRKTRPQIEKVGDRFKCYIYETKALYKPNGSKYLYEGKGKVIGEFMCDKITDMRDIGGEEFFATSCMTYEDWQNYTDYTKHIIWGWHISDLKIYDKPKELSEFCFTNSVKGRWDKNGCRDMVVRKPPQSYCYVEELADEV